MIDWDNNRYRPSDNSVAVALRNLTTSFTYFPLPTTTDTFCATGQLLLSHSLDRNTSLVFPSAVHTLAAFLPS
ncbi:hypothetical protein [Absidia glauca]|uniref:Uncharacterized protein n=1 Tax=Absidia glauca TaxID=4829 RepID=A0A163JYM8_ABSGL|nr:hypothetical protein [Absidia glauca]